MTQTPAIAHTHQVPSNPQSLASFDYAFNGTLNPSQVEEIATASFIGRGENLLLVGGPGTGKTFIAGEVCKQATALGLTSHYLQGFDGRFADKKLIDLGPGYIGSRQSRPGLLETLINCDVLWVDEVERWFEAAPTTMLVLLGRRIELGKSNILVACSGGWRLLCSEEGNSQRRPRESFDYPAFLLGLEPEQRSEWGMMMTHERFRTLPQLLRVLGITFTLPAVDGEQPVLQSILQPDFRPGSSPFAKKPVWHQVYTGEASYREILLRCGLELL